MRIGIDVSCWLNKRGYGRYTRELVRSLVERDSRDEYTLFLDRETARYADDLPPGASTVVVGTAQAAADAAAAKTIETNRTPSGCRMRNLLLGA